MRLPRLLGGKLLDATGAVYAREEHDWFMNHLTSWTRPFLVVTLVFILTI
jgi:hypothetical protein